jgi:predicted nucleic acid-binding Zn ribbon protein
MPQISPRDEILSAWRGGEWVRAEENRRASARSGPELIHDAVEMMRLEDRIAATQILKIWQNALDPTLTAHAQPSGYHKGTLFITVDSNVWLAEIIRYHREEILQRLQLAVGDGKVKKISYRLG